MHRRHHPVDRRWRRRSMRFDTASVESGRYRASDLYHLVWTKEAERLKLDPSCRMPGPNSKHLGRGGPLCTIKLQRPIEWWSGTGATGPILASPTSSHRRAQDRRRTAFHEPTVPWPHPVASFASGGPPHWGARLCRLRHHHDATGPGPGHSDSAGRTEPCDRARRPTRTRRDAPTPDAETASLRAGTSGGRRVAGTRPRRKHYQ